MSKLLLPAIVAFAFATGGCAPSSPSSSDPVDWSSAAVGEDAGVKRGDVVISAIYGGGGQTGAPFVRDYIELYNRTGAAISLDGWSIQTTAHDQNVFDQGNVIPLTGSIEAGKPYLIALASQGSVGDPLPTPIAVESDVDLAPDKGKVALVSNTTPLNCEGGAVPRCPNSKTVDFVGYGNANDFEGSVGQVGALSVTKAAARKEGGCQDKDDNAGDFAVGDPKPRSSGEPQKICPGPAAADSGAPRPDSGAPRPDSGPPPKVTDPPLGKESDYDAGVRRDAGSSSSASGASASDCNVANVGTTFERDASILAGALGLMVALAAILRRRS